MKELIHVISRGVDKRKIFLDERDYFRFIHDLYEFNDVNPVNTTFYIFQSNVIARRKIGEERKPRKLLVKIHAFCIMPNHYHLLLSENAANGIPKFMKKLNMGYARYFNERNKRKGTLFEGRYKPVTVKEESHFMHLPYYIHFNSLDLIMPEWRNRELRNYKKAEKFLENYRWSSHLDYLGKRNFPSVTQREFLIDFFGDTNGYRNRFQELLKDMDVESIRDCILE